MPDKPAAVLRILLPLAICGTLANSILAEPVTNDCKNVDDALAICGATWRAVPIEAPAGISAWTDGVATGKIIVQPSTLAAQIAAEDILNMAVESLAATLPAGVEFEVASGDVQTVGGDLLATLSYVVGAAHQGLHFRHTILVDDVRIIQIVIAAREADIDDHYQRMMSSLSFSRAGTTL